MAWGAAYPVGMFRRPAPSNAVALARLWRERAETAAACDPAAARVAWQTAVAARPDDPAVHDGLSQAVWR